MKIVGEKYEATLERIEQNRLDTAKVKILIGEAKMAEYTQVITFDQIQAARKDGTKRERYQIPNFSNATPEFLTDELGETREQLALLKEKEGVIKAALGARMKQLEAELTRREEQGKLGNQP